LGQSRDAFKLNHEDMICITRVFSPRRMHPKKPPSSTQ
jgi:hypothetical protein